MRLSPKTWIGLGLILYFGFISLYSMWGFQDYSKAWRVFGVPAEVFHFLDTRVILSGMDCLRLGKDPLIENPCDPLQRITNYPRAWMLFAATGVTQEDTYVIAIGLGFLFFLCWFWQTTVLSMKDAGVYWLFLISPSVMLGVERGNSDLVIFILLSLALWFQHSRFPYRLWAAATCIFIAFVLKLYPLFAFVLLYPMWNKTDSEDKRWNAENVVFVVFWAMACWLYLYFTFDDLALIRQGTPADTWLSYGQFVLPGLWSHLLFSHFHFSPWNYIPLLAILWGITVFWIRQQNHQETSIFETNIEFRSWMLSGLLYVGSFLIGNNHDYRLVFWLLALPQLLKWIKAPGAWSTLNQRVILAMGFSLYLSRIPSEYHWGLDELFNWYVFAYFVYGLYSVSSDKSCNSLGRRASCTKNIS